MNFSFWGDLVDVFTIPIGSVHCDPENVRTNSALNLEVSNMSLPCVLGGLMADDFPLEESGSDGGCSGNILYSAGDLHPIEYQI